MAVFKAIARPLPGYPKHLLGPIKRLPDMWMDPDNPVSRLPECYKKFYLDWKEGPETPVHWRPSKDKWERLESGQVIPILNIPVKVLYPPEHHEGLWGGEGVVVGYYKDPGRFTTPQPELWLPNLIKTVVYSEILDVHMSVVATRRTLNLIDDHFGFDLYILETRNSDLRSKLALKIKRKLLLTVSKKEMYPDNPEKQEEIYNKYKKFLLPPEELEWYGLTIPEAAEKLRLTEEERDKPVPLKMKYRMELFQELKEKQKGIEEGKKETSSLSDSISKFNPFKKIEEPSSK